MAREIKDFSTPTTERNAYVGLRPGECPIADRECKYGVERMLTSTAQYLRMQLSRYGQRWPDCDITDPAIQDWIVLRWTQRMFSETKGWRNWDDNEEGG